MASKITDFIKSKEKEPELASIQGYVPRPLRRRVLEQMQKDREVGFEINWNSFVEAACLSYLAERQKNDV